jgi:hypothetical protein
VTRRGHDGTATIPVGAASRHLLRPGPAAPHSGIAIMTDEDHPLDDAIELAARRTRDAQDAFLEVPPEVEEALRRVVEVERRADDLETLTSEPELPVDQK